MPAQNNLVTLLGRPNTLVSVAICTLTLLAAAYTIAGVGMEMSAVQMTAMARMSDMPSAHPPGQWSPSYALLVLAMWWVMMVAMMTPSATPTILLHAALMGQSAPPPRAGAMLMLAGYLLVWGGFALGATLCQWGAEAVGLMSAGMMTITAPWLGAVLFIAAGLWQLTTLKDACLRHCQSPAEFITAHRRVFAKRFGSFRFGVKHGLYCLGCCWGLMALLFVGGVMNLYWIVFLSLLVAAEKHIPARFRISKIAGVAMIGFGISLGISAL